MTAIDIPGYVIRREVGVGGMASVYLALQTSLDREVALKIMSPALAADPTFSKRFLQEARMLASLAHPNIVQVYDVGVTQSHSTTNNARHHAATIRFRIGYVCLSGAVPNGNSETTAPKPPAIFSARPRFSGG